MIEGKGYDKGSTHRGSKGVHEGRDKVEEWNDGVHRSPQGILSWFRKGFAGQGGRKQLNLPVSFYVSKDLSQQITIE